MIDLWGDSKDTKYPEKTIVYKIKHPSGNLLIGIGHLNEVGFHYVPGDTDLDEFKVINREIRKLKTKNSNNNKYCSCCPRESTMIHCGLPLCDDCWDETCYIMEVEQEKVYVKPEFKIEEKEVRDILFD